MRESLNGLEGDKIRKMLKNRNGITLIALVITVIVMLILAGVIISSVVGENSLFSKIGNARNIYEDKSLKEKNALIDIADEIEDEMYGMVEKVNDTAPGILEGEGTELNPFIINSIEDLVAFSENIKNGTTYENQYIKLGVSLNFNSTKSYVDYARKDFMGYSGELKNALTTGSGFQGIGINTSDDKEGIYSLKGNFDGNNNKIIGLYMNINNEEEWTRAGFFGNNCGVINNLELINCNITGMVTGSNSVQCGGIIGHNYGEINNCIVRGKIYGIYEGVGGSYIGGICAYNDGTINKCFNYAELDIKSNKSGSTNIAGIVGGSSSTGVIKNVYNYGKIDLANHEAKYFCIGGILGYGKCLVENSINFSDIIIDGVSTETGIYIAGVVGTVTSDSTKLINGSFNKGNIICSNLNSKNLYVGGIAGQSNQISNCYNLGNIECTNNNVNSNLIVGGITGLLTKDNNCQNSYNIGNINIQSIWKKTDYIGGIIGRNNGIVDKCYNFSEKIRVNSLGENYVGGIVGWNENKIINSYNKFINIQNIGIEVTGENAIRNCVGGIVGYNASTADTSKSRNDVKILAENGNLNNIGGICGYNGSMNGNFGIVANCEYKMYSDVNYTAIGGGIINDNTDGSEDYVITEKIIDVINGDNMFKEDINNVNKGYPVLIWQ